MAAAYQMVMTWGRVAALAALVVAGAGASGTAMAGPAASGATASPSTASRKTIFGVHEKVHIKELGITLPAKLDTGAESASLSATSIRRFEENDRPMVEFDVALSKAEREKWGIDKDALKNIRLPLDGHVRIKRRAESRDHGEQSYSRRPVVELTLCVGGRRATVAVNLTDRSHFRYPLLVGSDALRVLGAVIDPSVSMGSGNPRCAETASKAKQ